MNEYYYAWDWTVDYCFHRFFENGEYGTDFGKYVKLLEKAVYTLFCDEKVITEVQENLKSHLLTDSNKRILLACIVVRALTSLEQSKPVVFLYEEESLPLKSMLVLINDLKLCFGDLKQQQLLDKLWMIAFRQFVNKEFTEKVDECLDDIIAHCGKNIPKSLWSTCISSKKGQSDFSRTASAQEFLSAVLEIIHDLHSQLKKPFLVKVQEKLVSHHKNTDEDVTMAQLSQVQNVWDQFKVNLASCDHLVDANVGKKRQLNSDASLINVNVADASPVDTAHSEESNLVNDKDHDMNPVKKKQCEDSASCPDPKRAAVDVGLQNGTASVENPGASANSFLASKGKNPPGNKSPPRRVWSKIHDAYIILGVEKYGVGSWSQIQKEFPFPSLNTGTHIKDRWRTLVRKGYIELHSDKTIKKINSSFNRHLRFARRQTKRNDKTEEKAARNNRSEFALKANESLHGQCVQVDKTLLKGTNSKRSVLKVGKKSHNEMVQVDKTLLKGVDSEGSRFVFGGRKPWSKEEDSFIILGVSEFGNGSWARIKKSFSCFSNRTNVNIKDRWRTMLDKQIVELSSDGKIAKLSDEHKDLMKKIMKLPP